MADRPRIARGLRWGSVALTGALALGALAIPAASADPAFGSVSPTEDNHVPAFPPSTTVSSAAAWIDAGLSARSSALANLVHSVSTSTTLTASDSASLQAMLGVGATAISPLTSKVPTETTLTALHTDATTMIDARIFVLVTPVVNDVIAVDSDLSSVKALRQQWTALGAAITIAREARRDVTLSNSYERDLGNRLTKMTNEIGTLSATLLLLQPQSWPGPQSVLRQATSALSQANSNLTVAQSDENQIVSLLARSSKTTSARRAVARIEAMIAAR